MNYPTNLKYAKSHEWVEELEDGKVRMGISDYAQDQLGNIVFVNLPQEGDAVNAEDSFMDLESVKAVSDLYSPATGEITAVNQELEDAPELLNENPYGAWIVEISDVTALGELMSAAEYEAFCQNESH